DAVRTLVDELDAAWAVAAGGGIPWRKGDGFRNVPANGPAALLAARTGNVERAQATVDWIADRLANSATGLVYDGLHPDGVLETTTYTYCQGVVLGANAELAARTGEPRHRARVHCLVDAVAEHLSLTGVLPGTGPGDGGLFAGILARYLALVATRFPAETAARELVLTSADAAWAHRGEVDGLPRFGTDWSQPAGPERDLSVQVSGWMLLEAAASLER
ncbi:MAG: glycoside hydrolase family 76 protein, partial [Mycobacteriaceae bacterium]